MGDGKKEMKDMDFGRELAAIPFQNIIGGALSAAINAQIQASHTTLNFIQSVGFKNKKKGKKGGNDLSELLYVEFKYDQPTKFFGMGSTQHRVKVPFLSMLPIPMLRVDTLKVKFSAKLTQAKSVDTQALYSMTSISNNSTESSGSQSVAEEGASEDDKSSSSVDWERTTSFMGVMSDQIYNNQGMNVSREYSIKVELEAGQDYIPAGLEKILDILTGNIREIGRNNPMDKAMAAKVQDAMAGEQGADGAAKEGGGV
mmetsp:Transcript_5916/g.15060  ORF Transcript_5916/g.15060 Transcript_5916/m.15060 type:complete len:257 (+) Transcript_5916:183-953(+)|eukprot:CAMPEP_0177650914 /NCGR_PEP_ID=MMETSP0447-20121125/12227_1 /TAXON_ID=0 /ORGANISM="Stygamoeba regulata, Strain BSH-02190019" /LENGTH=256 /DNA_ID=CAMNT_0019153877 /DNA_START=168 /DNA_END=938 /DNA_ORIENTATION=+